MDKSERINWTSEELATWDNLIERLTNYFHPTRVDVSSKRRRVAILKANEIIKSDARFTVSIPENDWREDDSNSVGHERWFVVSLYIDKLRRSLEAQGFIVK